MSDPTLRFWFTDSVQAGESLVALLLDEQNRAWNATMGIYAAMPRTSDMEVPLMEMSELPGTFRPTGTLPTLASGATILVRVEHAGDSDRIPITSKSFASNDLLVSIEWGDILDLIVRGSGVDGRADDTLGRVILEHRSFEIGGRLAARGRDARGRRTLRGGPTLTGTNEQIRRLVLMLADPLVSSVMPPDAFL